MHVHKAKTFFHKVRKGKIETRIKNVYLLSIPLQKQYIIKLTHLLMIRALYCMYIYMYIYNNNAIHPPMLLFKDSYIYHHGFARATVATATAAEIDTTQQRLSRNCLFTLACFT